MRLIRVGNETSYIVRTVNETENESSKDCECMRLMNKTNND